MAKQSPPRPRITSLHGEIEFWRGEARRMKSDAWMFALGAAYGLSIARDDWMPKGADTVSSSHDVPTVSEEKP